MTGNGTTADAAAVAITNQIPVIFNRKPSLNPIFTNLFLTKHANPFFYSFFFFLHFLLLLFYFQKAHLSLLLFSACFLIFVSPLWYLAPEAVTAWSDCWSETRTGGRSSDLVSTNHSFSFAPQCLPSPPLSYPLFHHSFTSPFATPSAPQPPPLPSHQLPPNELTYCERTTHILFIFTKFWQLKP